MKRSTILFISWFILDLQLNYLTAQTAKNDMVFVPGGSFMMGNDLYFPDEGPKHKVSLDSFYISKYEITMAEFKKFVTATGFITTAERSGFTYVATEDGIEENEGVNWRYDEEGDERDESEYNFPVVHVSWNDAVAYCEWAGGRLPTEAEWEYAASIKASISEYYCGCDYETKGFWSGENSEGKIHQGGLKSPNKIGIYDMCGNVSEWCNDWYKDDYYRVSPKINPQGPRDGNEKVIRGGSWGEISFFCRSSSRSSSNKDFGLNIIGFRLVKDIDAP